MGVGGARFITLLAAVVALVVTGCARTPLVPKATVLASEPVEWEIQTEGDLPRVGIDLGRRTAWCLVDTGANSAVFTQALARHWELPHRRPEHWTADFPHVQLARVRTLQLHGAQWEGFSAAVFPNEFLQFRGVDALLGVPLFADCTLQVDYAAQRVRLFQRPPAAHAADLVPARFGRDGRPYVGVDIAGQRHWALLDTGFSDALIIPQRLAERLTFKAPPLHGVPVITMYTPVEKFGIGRIDAMVRLGRHEILNPIVLIRSPRPLQTPANLAAPIPQDSSHDELVIGSGVLKHFVLTVDQRSRTVVLQRQPKAPIIMPSVASYGFAVMVREGRVTVERVAEGSAAEKAGLRPGDLILSVNGTTAESVSLLLFDELLSQEVPLQLHVRRFGRELLIHVPVTMIVQ